MFIMLLVEEDSESVVEEFCFLLHVIVLCVDLAMDKCINEGLSMNQKATKALEFRRCCYLLETNGEISCCIYIELRIGIGVWIRLRFYEFKL